MPPHCLQTWLLPRESFLTRVPHELVPTTRCTNLRSSALPSHNAQSPWHPYSLPCPRSPTAPLTHRTSPQGALYLARGAFTFATTSRAAASPDATTIAVTTDTSAASTATAGIITTVGMISTAAITATPTPANPATESSLASPAPHPPDQT